MFVLHVIIASRNGDIEEKKGNYSQNNKSTSETDMLLTMIFTSLTNPSESFWP